MRRFIHAYAVRLPSTPCQMDGCEKDATFAVYDTVEQHRGIYCGRHAGELVHELNHQTRESA